MDGTESGSAAVSLYRVDTLHHHIWKKTLGHNTVSHTYPIYLPHARTSIKTRYKKALWRSRTQERYERLDGRLYGSEYPIDQDPPSSQCEHRLVICLGTLDKFPDHMTMHLAVPQPDYMPSSSTLTLTLDLHTLVFCHGEKFAI